MSYLYYVIWTSKNVNLFCGKISVWKTIGHFDLQVEEFIPLSKAVEEVSILFELDGS